MLGGQPRLLHAHGDLLSRVAPLPAALSAYLDRNLSGPRAGAGARIEQAGEIRLAPDGAWLPFTAEQSFDARRCGFVWHAKVRMAPFVTAVVEDAYRNDSRATMYTPAVTMVAAWISADTGVGPAML